MAGYAFMGAAHSHAWRTAPRFFDLPLQPQLTAVAGRNADGVRAAAGKLGWESAETDWRRLIERDDIDLVDICTPGDTHAEIAVAALEAGKHVLCEKPLANSVDEAERMAAAAEAAAKRGVFAMCGFSYRRTPALALAQRMVEEGRLGTIRHVRAQYLQDWLSDENAPMTWRLDKGKSGSGSLGDIGAHIIDTAQWLTGQKIAGVSALLETFVPERPLAGNLVGLGGQGDAGAEAPRGAVTVDDAAIFSARFDGGAASAGAVGVFEATRYALGRKNAMRLELNGTKGSLAFDFEDMNVLSFYEAADSPDAGFRRILVTEPEHP
jgi:predicted dehydrogenase